MVREIFILEVKDNLFLSRKLAALLDQKSGGERKSDVPHACFITGDSRLADHQPVGM